MKKFTFIFLISFFCFLTLLAIFSLPVKNEICCMFAATRHLGLLLSLTKVTDNFDVARLVHTLSITELLKNGWSISINWIVVLLDLVITGILTTITIFFTSKRRE